MIRGTIRTLLFVCCLCAVPMSSTAQEVVHALVGTVSVIDATAKTITVKTEDGSEGLFKDSTGSKIAIDFNKDLRAQTTAADAFTKTGTKVIVYYFGDSDVRTAVSLQNLGTGPFTKSSGTVVKFDRHKHLLTIKSGSGANETFQIGPKTIAETSSGAVEGEQFEPRKGDQVRVTASPDGAGQTALFINAS